MKITSKEEKKEKERIKRERLKAREANAKLKAKVKREDRSLPKKADALWSKVVRLK